MTAHQTSPEAKADREAWAWVAENQDYAHWLVLRFCSAGVRRHHYDDLVQVACLAMYKARRQWVPTRSKISTFASLLAYQEFARWHDHNGRHGFTCCPSGKADPALSLDVGGCDWIEPADERDTIDRLEKADEVVRLNKVIATLDKELQEFVRLWMRGVNKSTIAWMTGVNVNTVTKRRKRATELIRQRMGTI